MSISFFSINTRQIKPICNKSYRYMEQKAKYSIKPLIQDSIEENILQGCRLFYSLKKYVSRITKLERKAQSKVNQFFRCSESDKVNCNNCVK